MLAADISQKLNPFWTSEDLKRLDEITEKERKLIEDKPDTPEWLIDNPAISPAIFELNTQMAQLIADIEGRYIQKRGKRGLLSDARDIIDLIEKGDFVDSVIDPSEETFKNCYIFFVECLRLQIIGLGEEKIRPLIEKRISQWYEKPQGFYMPPLFPQEKSALFSLIRQGPATNTLTKINIRHKDKNINIDPITGTAKAQRGDFYVVIPDFTSLDMPELKQTTLQLLDALTATSTAAGGAQSISISLEEYMTRRGLKDRKEARRQAEEDLKALHKAHISFKGKISGKAQDYYDVNILDAQGISNGIIRATFGSTLFNILTTYPVMPYPAELWTFNSKNNPNSYYLLRKISEHKNMNIGKKNEDIIAVKTLIDVCPDIPSYEEVMETNKAVKRRIIDRFERDLDAIKTIKEWHYCHSLDTPLTDKELAVMDHKTFIKLLVKIDWGEQYPKLPRTHRDTAKKPVKKKS